MEIPAFASSIDWQVSGQSVLLPCYYRRSCEIGFGISGNRNSLPQKRRRVRLLLDYRLMCSWWTIFDVSHLILFFCFISLYRLVVCLFTGCCCLIKRFFLVRPWNASLKSVYTRSGSAKGNGVQEEEIERVISARASFGLALPFASYYKSAAGTLVFVSLLSFLDAHLFLNRLLK